MDIAAFRVHFPEFADVTAWPDSIIEFWAELAEQEVSRCRFGDIVRPKAVEILTAHYLALSKLNGVGPNPGTGGGIASSKSVGDVSVSYDLSSINGVTGSLWSGTRYGTMFASMARRYGAGAVQL